jgi:GDP-L-fucose synthase
MRIFLAGHRGLVGSTIHKILKNTEHEIVVRTHKELDLSNQALVNEFFAKEKFDQVYLAAAKVGGVYSNNVYPADFIYHNLMIQTNVIHAAHVNDVQKLLMLGSNCIYPRVTEQPIKENLLMTGHLEPTNEPYAIAKIAGVKMCESYNRQYGRDYRSVLPCNLYGPGDNFDVDAGHVAAGIIHKMHTAKIKGDNIVKIWGTGRPRREFLYSEDMAEACIHVMNVEKNKWDAVTEPRCNYVNLGSGYDIPISEFVKITAEVVDYQGGIEYDTTRPDGAMSKLTDNSKINSLGWKPRVELIDGLKLTYEWYLNNVATKTD